MAKRKLEDLPDNEEPSGSKRLRQDANYEHTLTAPTKPSTETPQKLSYQIDRSPSPAREHLVAAAQAPDSGKGGPVQSLNGMNGNKTSHPTTIPSGSGSRGGSNTKSGEPCPQTHETLGDWIFAGEAEEDYTRGPARMVQHWDGTKICPAIVLNYELSRKMQDAEMGQRKLHVLKEEVRRERARICAQDRRLYRKYSTTMKNLHDLQGGEGKSRAEKQYGQQNRTKRLLAELKKIERSRLALQDKEHDLVMQLKQTEHYQQQLQIEVFMTLQDVLVDSKLLPSFANTIRGDRQRQQIDDHTTESSYETTDFNQYSRPQMQENARRIKATDEQNQVEKATRAVAERELHLQRCRWALDQHRNNYQAELRRYADAYAHRQNTDVEKEFGPVYLQQGQQFTRNVIDAENALKEAKEMEMQAFRATNKSPERFTASFEQIIVPDVDRTHIEKWLNDLPDPETMDDAFTKDDRSDNEKDTVSQSMPDSCDDTNFDSISVLDYGYYRDQIDQQARKWRNGDR